MSARTATPGKPAVPAVTEEQRTGWQRYSWTGGPVETAPAFPGDGWQANTASDPHGIGVEGAYDVSHGSSGNADPVLPPRHLHDGCRDAGGPRGAR